MKIIKEKNDVSHMIKLLLDDLLNPDRLRAISRVPEPRGGLRYREVLKKLYLSLGTYQAAVIVEYKDGRRRYYVFIVRALVSEDVKDFSECPVEALGYIIERDGRYMIYREFKRATMRNVEELYKVISDVGDKFRWSDIEIYLKRTMEFDDYFWL